MLRAHLREIQRAPERKRKFLFTVASAATMVVVVTLWVIYLNLTIPASEENQKPATAKGEELGAGDTFGETLGRGFSAISGDMAEEWKRAKATADESFRTLRETLERKNQFTFEASTSTPTSTPPESFDYKLKTEGSTAEGLAPSDAEGLMPVPPTPLPKAPAK